MQRYIIEENIRRFTALLERERSPDRQRIIQQLLSEEESKLDELNGRGADRARPV